LHEHTLPVDVSCREDMRYIALQVVVDRDITAFGHNTSCSQVERIHIACPASRKEDRVYGQTGWTLLLSVSWLFSCHASAVKGDHTLDTGRPPENQLESLLWWVAASNECSHSRRPAPAENIEVLDS